MTLRRQLRFLRAYAMLNTLIVVVLATAAFRQGTPQKFDELNAQRINIVDADGTLRMVISNKDRMHPGVIDGKTIDRPRPVAGMLFFNDEGDEAGGLTFTGRVAANGARQANAGLMFDQLKQDQTIGFSYSEGGGRRSAGFQVWDRSDTPLGELIDKLNAANKIADKAARDAELAKIRAAAPPGPRRLFVGKNADKAALVSLADADGKPRLTLTVDAAGNPRIEFLDAAGKVVSRLPEK
jgi:hypothetical protein